jgi:hypothetical protein
MTRVAALLCTLLLAACAHATAPHAMSSHDGDSGHHEVALTRTPAAGERVVLEVELGVIGSGREVVLRTWDGLLIGTISPYGIRPGNAAGTYAVPVPPEALRRALRDGRLRLQFLIETAGVAARPVRADEVRSVRAVLIE